MLLYAKERPLDSANIFLSSSSFQQKSNSLLITRNVSPLSHPFQVKIKGNFPVGFQYNAFVLYLFKFEINVSEIASFNIYITILKTSKAKTIKGKSAAINKCNISDSFS